MGLEKLPLDALELLVAGFSGDTSGVIERQEARGQQNMVARSQLPCESPWEALEKMGVKKLNDGDGVLCAAQLPDGWSIEPTDHSMWSSLCDDKGRKRAGIFYKAAFYDRSAHMHLTRRYNAQVRPVGGWSAKSNKYEGVILDGDTAIYTHPQTVEEPTFDASARAKYMKYLETKDEINAELETELRKRFPNYEDATAYWD
jgi:hypothetical protein